MSVTENNKLYWHYLSCESQTEDTKEEVTEMARHLLMKRGHLLCKNLLNKLGLESSTW
jgi:hypothetical protein